MGLPALAVHMQPAGENSVNVATVDGDMVKAAAAVGIEDENIVVFAGAAGVQEIAAIDIGVG